MKGLLYKDWRTLLKYARLYLLMMAIFALIPGSSIRSFALIYAGMLPFTIISYDEHCKWNRLAAMLPYTHWQLVLSKYLLGWIAVGETMLLALLAQLAACMIGGVSQEFPTQAQGVLFSASIALLLMAVTLPCIFRFGVEKARLLFMSAIVVGMILSSLAGETMLGDLNSGAAKGLSGAVLLAALVGNAISVIISKKLYRRGLAAR